MLSILARAYEFGMREPQNEIYRLPHEVNVELLQNFMPSIFWFTDILNSVAPSLSSCGASALGLGVTNSTADPRHTQNRLRPGSRCGEQIEVSAPLKQFWIRTPNNHRWEAHEPGREPAVVFRHARENAKHINNAELRAIHLYQRWLSRTTKWHRSKGLLVSDSLAAWGPRKRDGPPHIT